MADLISNALVFLYVWIVEKPRELVEAIIEWSMGSFTDSLLPALFDLMPESLQMYLAQVPWQGMTGALQDIAWIVPVWQVLTIVAGAYTLCASIRLSRWILALVPTIGG